MPQWRYGPLRWQRLGVVTLKDLPNLSARRVEQQTLTKLPVRIRSTGFAVVSAPTILEADRCRILPE